MRKIIVVTAAFLICCTGTAFASHPLISDDAVSLGKGNLQIEINGEIGTDTETVNGSKTRTESSSVSTSFGYGLTEKLDVNFGIARPWGSIDVDGTQSNVPGSVDFSVGLKYQIYEKDGFSIALKPGFGYSYAVNTSDDDYTTSYSAAVVLTKELEPFSFHLNLGYTYNNYNLAGTCRNSVWSISGATVYEARKNMKLVADIGANSNGDRTVSEMPVFAILGSIYSLNKTIDVSVGGKIGITSAETDFSGLFGIALNF